jgi:hypothetical protein
MSAIGAIIASVAAKVGAELVGKVVGGRFGEAGGDLAERVVKSVAERAGVQVEQLPDAPPAKIEEAVEAIEAKMPELILAHVEQQRATHAFLLAPDKPKWVNGWQWFLMALWGWNGVAVSLINWGFAAGVPVIPWDALGWLTAIYQALNMGGHWSSRMADKFLGRRA